MKKLELTHSKVEDLLFILKDITEAKKQIADANTVICKAENKIKEAIQEAKELGFDLELLEDTEEE